jgi:hypothetical protein
VLDLQLRFWYQAWSGGSRTWNAASQRAKPIGVRVAMKPHHFERESNYLICVSCGLHWDEIRNQPTEEGKSYYGDMHYKIIEEDDCEVRRRINDLKAFW